MEAAFLSGFASASLQLLFDRFATLSVSELSLFKDVDDNLRKLQRSFLRIQAMVDFVEYMHIGHAGKFGSSGNKAWQVWLEDLKKLMYEADDFLDDIYLNSSKYSSSSDETQVNNTVRDMLLSFLKVTVPGKIAKLQDSLEDMSNEMNLFFMSGVNRFEASSSENTTRNDVIRRSLVDDKLIVGREREKEEILSMLRSSERNVVVLPVVGMAGVGKTTLAHIIYNETTVFHSRIWISVSIEFDIERIMKSIIESVTLECCNYSELNLIQAKVQQLLSNEKFVLVLDGYWSESHGDWEILSSLFNDGCRNSLVIVTTQSDTVSSIVGTVPAYRLQCLSDEECWQLMRQRAFLNKNFTNIERMEFIGNEISMKCKGSPLAAKALGSVLYHRDTEEEWGAIAETELWDLPHFRDEISPALLLSFNYLPVHLKKCFAYCSIFPPNHEFEKEDLVLLWMAEGFIQPIEGRKLEDIGDDYFDDLLGRCFFQLSDTSGYKMHNVIYLLAHMVSVDICMRMKVDDASQYCLPLGRNIRHISVHHDGPRQIRPMKASPRLKGLRTFILMSGNGLIDNDLFYIYKLLRVLDLSGCGIDEIPDSIELLSHLRYLDLSEGRMRKLPKQLSKLFGLQTLKLKNCSSLHDLPVNFSKLINLRHLEFDVKPQLKSMPIHFGRLVNLQQLSAFIVKRDKGCGIEQLKTMKCLRGTLCITNLEDVSEVTEGILDNKPGLEKLTFEWSSMITSGQSRTSIELAERVLKVVKPHQDVKELTIVNYCGYVLPDWLCNPLAKITTLNLTCCNCFILRPLGKLKLLKVLKIHDMPRLEIINDMFCCSGEDNVGFPSLETLEFKNMDILKEWSGLTKSMPYLNELKLINCPFLKSVPTFVHLLSLQSLELSRCPKLESLPESAASFRSLVITECPIIKDRCNVDGGEDYHKVSRLQRLEIDYVAVILQDIS